MKAKVDFYSPKTYEIDGVILEGVVREEESEAEVSSESQLEDIYKEGKVSVVKGAEPPLTVVNGLKGLLLYFKPVRIFRVGKPLLINGQLQLNSLEVPNDEQLFCVGKLVIPNELPFIVLFTEEGPRIVTRSDINPPKAEVEEVEKRRSKRKVKRAKRRSKRRKVKGKSSRKSK